MKTISMTDLSNVTGGESFFGDFSQGATLGGITGALATAFTGRAAHMSTYTTVARNAFVGAKAGALAGAAVWGINKLTQ